MVCSLEVDPDDSGSSCHVGRGIGGFVTWKVVLFFPRFAEKGRLGQGEEHDPFPGCGADVMV